MVRLANFILSGCKANTSTGTFVPMNLMKSFKREGKKSTDEGKIMNNSDYMFGKKN